MAKRYGKDFPNYNASPAKKPKIDSSRQNALPKQKRQSVDGAGHKINDDLWGDDFDDDAIEEMDFILSQACSQDVNASTDSRIPSNLQKNQNPASNLHPVPSTSRAVVNQANPQISRIVEPRNTLTTNKTTNATGQLYSQKLASSENIRNVLDDNGSMMFDEFQRNLLGRGQLNSTFHPRNSDVISDDRRLQQLDKLEENCNGKILKDLIAKDGEIVYLRKQIEQTQLRAQNESMEKARLIEEQASRHRAEINALHKDNDNMKTQNEFQSLQLSTLIERCKLLESGAVKLTQPQKAIVDSPIRNRFGPQNRSTVPNKTTKVSEISVQTSSSNSRLSWKLKTPVRDRPLDTLPQSIFEKSLPEKSVVDIEIIEKFGKKNLPILQEEETCRIFENPDLVKPIVTFVDDRKLNIEYIQPDITVMMKKTMAEINSIDCITYVNKIVSTTRELLLNATVVLQRISQAMKNDDIRDMNDLYFSDFYDTKIDYNLSICDSDVWYEKERGIEARRSMGALSYIAKASNYLGDYFTGKTQLIVHNDANYNNYIEQMIRYKESPKKGHDFEILEMILDFVVAIGFVRRSHQFSGLICAITSTLCNVHERVGFCPKGLEYISRIFKELVFARPLARCFISMTKMLAVFVNSTPFGKNLCSPTPNVTSLEIWKDVLHFTADACSLEIYMAQVEILRLDSLTTIDLSYEYLTFVQLAFLSNSIPWTLGFSDSCNCCLKVLTFTITLLCNCSKIDLKNLENENTQKSVVKKLDNTFWRKVKRTQMCVLRKGLQFLSYLAKRDPDFITKATNVEDSFYLFMHNVNGFEELFVHENEQESMAIIKSTLMLDKPFPTDQQRSQKTNKFFNIKSACEEKSYPSPTSGQWYNVSSQNRKSSQQLLATYEELLNDG